MGDGAGIGRQAERVEWRGRRREARTVADSPGGVVAGLPSHPTVVDRVSVGEAAQALDISAATVRRRIHTGELAAERVGRHGRTAWAVRLPAPSAEPAVERVVHTAPAAAAGLALWCGMAALAQQLAKANASQARARHALGRENDRLVRENGRLVAELEDAVAALASQAGEHARAGRRARWLVAGLSLAVVALGALLLVLGPLATVGRLGA